MDNPLDGSRGEPPAPPAQEHRPAIAAPRSGQRLPEVKIAPEREDGARPDRHDPLLPALPSNLQLVREQIQVFEVHPAQLR
jgi:hypothetical protein